MNMIICSKYYKSKLFYRLSLSLTNNTKVINIPESIHSLKTQFHGVFSPFYISDHYIALRTRHSDHIAVYIPADNIVIGGLAKYN